MDRLRFGELDVEDDAEHGRALFNLKQVLVLLLELLRAVLVLEVTSFSATSSAGSLPRAIPSTSSMRFLAWWNMRT